MTHQERTERRKEMADKVFKGATIGEVANEYEVSMTSVRNSYQTHYGEPFNVRVGVPRACKTIRIVAQLLNTNDSLTEISKRVGAAYQRVQDVNSQLAAENVAVPMRK